MTRYIVLTLAACVLGSLGAPAQADPTPEGSLTIRGAYLGYVVPMPGGAVAVMAYAEDGSRRAVHVLQGSNLRHTTTLPRGRNLVSLDDNSIVASYRGFDIYDAKSGALLKHRQFERFGPPGAGMPSHWLDGNVLTLIGEGETYADSYLRRVRIPELEVVERLQAPVTGAFVRWKDRIVAVGHWAEGKGSLLRPSVMVLDAGFRVIARTEVAPGKNRENYNCSLPSNANPVVVGDLLVYSADCGSVRLHDLKTMRQVAERGPLGTALGLRFATVDGKLLAFGWRDGSLAVDEVELPSLRSKRLLSLSEVGQYAASGDNLYVFPPPTSLIGLREFTVRHYRLAQRKAE